MQKVHCRGQVEIDVDKRSSVNSSEVRPGSAASLTGPTPGVSPIQKSQQDQPTSVAEPQGGSHPLHIPDRMVSTFSLLWRDPTLLRGTLNP